MRKKHAPALAAFALLALNILVAWRLFFIEHIIHFGSVEPVFFAIAKAIRQRWPGDWFDLGWWAQSSVGTPFAYTYQPLLHHVVAATAALSNWSEARAYHVVLATFYCFGPVTLFALALRLTRSVGASFTAGLLYTFLSPSAFLIPLIAVDMGNRWFARRLHTATVWGDGPNVAALTLLPLAILFLDRARERRTPGAWALAAISIISVPLINIPAAIALATALVAYALACDVREWPKAWIGIAGAGLGGFALFAIWLPPSSLLLTAANAQWMSPEGRFSVSKLPYYLLFAVCVPVIRLLLTRASFALRFAALFAFITAAVALPAAWFHIDLIGQAQRFHVAMEMPIILTIVLVGFALVKWTPGLRIAVTVGLAAICLLQLSNYWRFAKNDLREGDVSDRAEFKIARWMDANAGTDRIYAPGAVSLWFNYLARQPQLIGCCDQNLLMPIVVVAHYVLGSDDGAGDRAAEISIAWLQVMGVHYAAVNGPLSNEPYKDFRHPEKFKGILKEVWHEGDDMIYEVPLASPSLAHVVRPDELIASVPENGLRIEPLEKYRAAILDPARPQADLTWTSTRDILIHGTLPAGHLYSLQIPYHVGWRADAGVLIAHDALGFMTVEPQCTGPCDVHLRYDGGIERTVLRYVTVLAWLTLAVWFVSAARRRRV